MDPKVYTPTGVQDILFEQCEQKRGIEHKIREHLKSNGYREIETPSIEYFDTFSTGVGRIAQENMYTFSGSDGKLLVLRPDLTIPAVRTYATKLRNGEETVKLFYIGNAFSPCDSGGGRLKEYTQAGAEIIGGQGVYVDAEIITRAVMLARGMGLKGFLVDICQVEFFKGLMEEAGFSEREAEEIRKMVDGKQMGSLEKLLSQKDIPVRLKELLVNLPNLFGGTEILNAAAKCTENPRSVAAISYLRNVMKLIEESGLGKYVSIDLGMVSSLNYYTGIIFKGFTNGVGFPFISGGRYDTLAENYGVCTPATGFSMGINLLMQALTKQSCDSNHCRYLTVALPKGRLGELALSLFEKAGVDISELEQRTRKLILTDEKAKVRFFLVKPADVPTYVDYGAADVGVVGRDTIMEENRNLYEVLDLGYGKCRMCVAGPKELKEKWDTIPNKCVATKYPHIARDYFEHTKQESVEIIKLNGSIELAPLVGLSHVIVDIVESGRTLEENGLTVLETIFDASARMIVNRVSMKIKRKRIKEIIETIKEQLVGHETV